MAVSAVDQGTFEISLGPENTVLYNGEPNGQIHIEAPAGEYRVRFKRKSGESWVFTAFSWTPKPVEPAPSSGFQPLSVTDVRNGPVLEAIVFDDEIIVKDRLEVDGTYKYSIALEVGARASGMSVVGDPEFQNKRSSGRSG